MQKENNKEKTTYAQCERSTPSTNTQLGCRPPILSIPRHWLNWHYGNASHRFDRARCQNINLPLHNVYFVVPNSIKLFLLFFLFTSSSLYVAHLKWERLCRCRTLGISRVYVVPIDWVIHSFTSIMVTISNVKITLDVDLKRIRVACSFHRHTMCIYFRFWPLLNSCISLHFGITRTTFACDAQIHIRWGFGFRIGTVYSWKSKNPLKCFYDWTLSISI